MSRHIFYVANTQADNLGDLIINSLLLKELSKRGDLSVNVRNCAKNYRDMIDATGARLINKSYLLYVLDMLFLSLKGKEVEFYLKPGHFYGNDGGVVKKGVTLLCYMLMKLSGIRISRLGASLGPYKPIAGKLEKYQSYCFENYTARENMSIFYAHEIGIKNIKYCPDMAFLLKKDTTEEEGDRRSVVISFRPKTLSDDDEILDLAPIVRNAISFFKDKKLVAVSQVTSDMVNNQSLLDDLNCGAKHIVFDNDDGSEIFNVYRSADYVLSNRLHVLLFAASKGAVPIPIIEKDKHIKIAGIFDASGLSDLVYDLNGDSDILDHLSKIVSEKVSVSKRLDKAFEEQQSNLANFLKSSGK